MGEDVTIGLETHVQLDTETKLFCGCPNEETDEPNSNVCEICLGHPGSKPRFNAKVLEIGVKVARALNFEVAEEIFFSRKTYFYPDMSKNYQITQYEIPLGSDGSLEIEREGEMKQVGLQRIHIEEDPASLEHPGGSVTGSDYTLVDYNRAGTPLLEIVTEPVLDSPEEAEEYIRELVRTLEYLGIYSSDSSLSVKSDANISLEGSERVEIKNINGVKGIGEALEHEVSRQRRVAGNGEEIVQHTRSYEPEKGVTEKMREKETEEDYGYIFDPDLSRQDTGSIETEEVELPLERRKRLEDEYGIGREVADSIVSGRKVADDFERLSSDLSPATVANWMTGELRKTLNYHDLDYSGADLEFDWIEYVLELVDTGSISDRNAEKLLREMVEDGRDPEDIVEEEDLLKAEEGEIDSVVDEVIEENPGAVEDYESGEEGAVNFLVGQVMQESGGKADPKNAREKILEKLE